MNTTKAFYLIAGLVLAVVLFIANPLGLFAIIGGLVALAAVFVVIENLCIYLTDKKESKTSTR